MEIPSKEQRWIEAFFSSPNDLVWDDLTSGNVEDLLRDEVHGWLQLLGNDEDLSPVLLPWITSEGTVWYACNHDERMTAQTGEELEAMVAHAYSRVERFPLFEASNPCETALRNRFGSHICRIYVTPGKELSVLRMLNIYRKLIERRPDRPQIGVRPPGKIRRIFDKALLAGNIEEARNCIEELKESGRLDLQNQRFLEIRLLAVQEKWQAIVSDLRTVVDLELPARIISDLVEAIYQTRLRKFEDDADPQGAIAAFQDFVQPKFGRLFRARKGLKTPSVLKSFLIEQICSDSPEHSVCQKILAEYPSSDPGFEYAQSLIKLVPKEPVSKDLIERAKEAFLDDKVELALDLYASCPPDKDILEKVLRCSRDVEAQNDLAVAWTYCQNCPEEWLEGLLPKQVRDYNALEETFTAQTISNWIDWAKFVLEGGDRKKSESLAQSGVAEWSVDDLLAEEDGVENFCRLLDEGVSQDANFFHNQFPYIYEFATNTQHPITQFRPLYGGLLELLAYAEIVSDSDLVLSQELVRSLFEVGVPADKYQEILNAVEMLWTNAKSIKNLDWALDVSELLAINPSPKPELVLNFFIELLNFVATNTHRVEKTTWMILNVLAQDFDAVEYVDQIKPVEEVTEETDEENPLKKKKIGIYSLTEPAAIRAKQLLEKIFPGIVVTVNHDHEATQALENLARSSDLFVFAWRSSKHQAYYCVKKHIDKERLLLPLGKGSTSIINCLINHVT